MSINILEIEPNKVPVNITDYSTFIYGPPKIGKTTLIHQMYGKKVLFLATEDRHKALPGAMIIRITTWNEYLNVLRQLKNPQVRELYDVIAVDTVENLYNMLEKYVAAKYGETKVGEKNDIWGADWTDLKNMWKDGINKISDLGYIPVFAGHATQKTVQIPVSGVVDSDLEGASVEKKIVKDKKTNKEQEVYEFIKYMPDVHDRAMGPINKMVDNILFLNTTVDVATGEERRVIYLRDTLQWQAGSTFEGIDPVVDLSAEAYQAAVERAFGLIDEEHTTTDSPNKGKDEGETFAQLMEKVKAYGGAFHKEGKLEELNRISEQVFGLGNKVTEANENQKELVLEALDKIEEKAKEENIEL